MLLAAPNTGSVNMDSLLLQALAKYFRARILEILHALPESVEDLHVDVAVLDSRGDIIYAQTASQPYTRSRRIRRQLKIVSPRLKRSHANYAHFCAPLYQMNGLADKVWP
jgi:hypothetical protein